jgi:RHS repeat-associated protein
MSRVTTIADPDGGTLTFSYSANDVLRTLKPAPPGENTKSAQYQYDGLGRLTSVCEITSASGSGACSQNTAATGFFTSYSYNALNKLTGVSQSGQTRSYGFDALGRLTSETNPETGTTTYTYDSDSTCGSSPGDMVKKVDAIGNVICFHYDTIHRLTSTTYPSGSYSGSTPEKVFVYDSATVNGNTMLNTAGRLAEAYTCTGSCSAKVTDLGFSYDADGNTTQIWESTPHSSGYYEVKAATYWPNGLPETLQLLTNSGGALIPTISYNPDGEGRVSSTSVSGGQNPLSSVNYNVLSEATAVNFGSADSDSFSYDMNTGRLTQYNFNVNGKTVTGNVGWNANGTLATLGITDPYDSSNSQSCTYSYDDLARITKANCGSIWSQTFGFDPFGNLSKSGTISFQPTYNTSTNQVTKVGGAAPSYDADGNTTNDTVNSYSWDSDGKMIKAVTPSMTTQVTYDAMDRAVEFLVGSSYTEVVYGPGGSKLALMSGQTLSRAFVPLAGGAVAVYNSSGLAYYRHPDWLASSRLASTPSRGVYYDGAYAPYGENYAETGTTDRSFTGENQDMVSSGSYPLYDFLMREYQPTWGRWISPDAAGLAAANPKNPQTWNRYAYVTNKPTTLTDPTGLDGNECFYYYCGPPDASYDINYDPNSWVLPNNIPCMAGEYGCDGTPSEMAAAEAQYASNFVWQVTGTLYGKYYNETFLNLGDYFDWLTGIAALPESQAYQVYLLACQYATTPCSGTNDQISVWQKGITYNGQLDQNPVDVAAVSEDGIQDPTTIMHDGDSSWYTGSLAGWFGFEVGHVVADPNGISVHYDDFGPLNPLHYIIQVPLGGVMNTAPATYTCSLVGGCQ